MCREKYSEDKYFPVTEQEKPPINRSNTRK